MKTDTRADYPATMEIWCTICLKHITRGEVWLSDDMRDGRLFCYDCAPDEAIRAKDTI